MFFFPATLSKAKGMKMFLGFFATKLPPNEEKPLQTCGGKKVREIFPPKMHFILWLVVSMIFYFHPYFGKSSNLTNIFQMGWFNHQLVLVIFSWSSNDKIGLDPKITQATNIQVGEVSHDKQIHTQEVQPPFFIGWFPNHHYFTRGLSSSKRNHIF